MIIISDIDGTACPSIFKNDGSQDQQSPAFQAELLAVPLLPWIVDLDAKPFKQARFVYFVTGRGEHLNKITASWIHDKFGLKAKTFTIMNIGFTTYQQYVVDKNAKLDSIIERCVKGRTSPFEPVHVIEDDKNILDHLVTVIKDMAGIIVHAVKDGKHSIVYPEQPTRRGGT